MARGAIAFLVVVGAGALAYWLPFATQQREVVTARPSLTGLFFRDEIPLPGGSTACLEPVPLADETTGARIVVRAPAEGRGAVPALELVASGPDGYRATGRITGYGRGDDLPLVARIASPPRDLEGRVCVRNTGDEAVALIGTGEARSDTRTATTVDGERRPDAALTLTGDGTTSLLGQLGTVVDRASALTGGLLPAWVLWPTFVLICAGIVAAPPWALWRAARDDVAA